ncbi:MAG: minor capsid protein [Bacteroidales bacterium]|nr:minor capsid protein [Bacteroidales bacterium]
MNNADYWRGRFAIMADAAQHKADRCITGLEEMYREAEQTVQADLERWYARFADNNGLSLSDARKMLTTGQMEEFRWSVEKYIQVGQQANLSPEWLKKLENASARFHVSRLEAVQIQIQQQLELLYGNQVDSIDGLLKQIVSNGYTRTAYEIQKGIGLGWDITALDQRKLETLLSKPWTADRKTFRDRCWEGKAGLVSGVQTDLTQGLLRGNSSQKITDAVKRRFNVSRYQAGRLVHTETTYFNAASARESYKELGVDKVEIIETLDSHTCDICGPLDGTVIPLSQYEPGVTVPPFHPNCRGTTAPAIDETILGERAARDQNGKVYYVPSNMKYVDWKQTFVNGGSKSGLALAAGTGAIVTGATPTGKALEGYTPDQQQEIQDLLDGAPQEVKDLYSKYGGQLQAVDEKVKSGYTAYYDPSDGRVHFHKADVVTGSRYETPYQTHFHEYAHNLDYLAGGGNQAFSVTYKNSAGETFEDVLRMDWKKALKDYYKTSAMDAGSVYQKAFDLQLGNGGMGGETYVRQLMRDWRQFNAISRSDPLYVALQDELAALNGVDVEIKKFYLKHFDKFGDLVYDQPEVVKSFIGYVKKTYSPIEIGDLSDMFEPFSVQVCGIDYPFGFGHGSSYASTPGKWAKETFAEMTDSAIASPDSLKLIQQYLPNAYQEYLTMLGVMAK